MLVVGNYRVFLFRDDDRQGELLVKLETENRRATIRVECKKAEGCEVSVAEKTPDGTEKETNHFHIWSHIGVVAFNVFSLVKFKYRNVIITDYNGEDAIGSDFRVGVADSEFEALLSELLNTIRRSIK